MLSSSFKVPLYPVGIDAIIRRETFERDLERAACLLREAWPAYAKANNLSIGRFEDDGNHHTDGANFLPTELSKTFVGGPIVITSSQLSLLQFRDRNAEMNPDVIALFGGGGIAGESIADTYTRESQEELNILCDHTNAFPLYLEGCVIRDTPWLRVIIGTVLDQFPEEMVVREGYGPVLMPEQSLLHTPKLVLPRSRADTLLLFRNLRAAA